MKLDFGREKPPLTKFIKQAIDWFHPEILRQFLEKNL
jgi:hypothetical protein